MAAQLVQLYTLENAVFEAYVFHAAVLALKVLAVAVLTAYYRVQRKVSLNQEDIAIFGKRGKLGQDPEVERVRRIHQNDLENVVPFWILAFLYVATDPNPTIALNVFRLFTFSRIGHTIVYFLAVRQPSRGITYGLGFIVNIYLIYSVLAATAF